MKSATLALAVALICIPGRSPGQTWSAPEQQIIDHTAQCWALWAAEDFDGYLAGCPTDPSTIYWFSHESVPNLGPSQWRKHTAVTFPRTEALYQELRPIAVRIFGDTALYYYWVQIVLEDMNGTVQTIRRHRMDVYQRRNDTWVGIGGTGASIPETG